MGALFGLLTSLSITTSELFARRITNEIGPVVAASIASLVAAGTALCTAFVTQGEPTLGDLTLGALSGVFFGLGLATYLQGVFFSSSAVIGPTSAALTALIPFGYAAVATALPPPMAFLGAGGAVVGLVLVTVGGGVGSNVAAGFPLGLISGLGYGVGTALLIEADDASGQWPVAAQRATAFVAIAVYAMLLRRPLLPPRAFAGNALLAGIAAGMSSVLLLAGLSTNAAAASVTASLYPASSVIVGRVCFSDAVTRTQVLGLAVVIGATTAIVLA